MAIEGNLGDCRLADILQTVAQQRKTGILTVQSDTTIVAVTFLAGDVVSADSLAQTVEERVGEVLVREGLVDRQRFAAIAGRQEAGEGRLLDLLVSDVGLTRGQVLGGLRRQTAELLAELLDWDEGEFKFYGGDEVSHEEGIEPIVVADFLLGHLDHPALEPPAPPPPAVAAAAEPDAERAVDAEPATAAAAARPVAPAAELRVDEEPAMPPPVPELPPYAAPAVGAALAAVLLLAVLLAPVSFLLPFPWQGQDRVALVEVQRLADHLAVDRAAKTFFLLEGRFPESLDRLAELALLDPEDLVDPSGRPLVLDPRADSYEIRPRGDDGDELARTEAITGNFLLEPDFLGLASTPDEEPPLVLLD
jgi:hypothetical protein